MGFSKDFIWGAATAAFQVEGAFEDDGKVHSIWDDLCKGHMAEGINDDGKTACDHYNRYREDVKLMKEIGLKAYRFSVSWCRVISDINGTVNEKGVKFYVDLCDELISNGIIPIITLYHWDLPMWAYRAGGWKNPDIVDWFMTYVKAITDALKNKAVYWITFNEPQCIIDGGYRKGTMAPFEKTSEKEVGLAARNLLLCHGKAVKHIREKIKDAKIGFATVSGFLESGKDEERYYNLSFSGGDNPGSMSFWCDPVYAGKISEGLKECISAEDMKTIYQPLDYFAFNLYNSANVYRTEKDIEYGYYSGMPVTAFNWPVTDNALYWACKFAYKRYKLPVFVTENGMANTDWVMSGGEVCDPQRADYLKRYLSGLKKAAEEDIPVMGYLYWSLFDNMEWCEGYSKRFGLIYVDYRDKKRTVKNSARYYSEVIKTNGENL